MVLFGCCSKWASHSLSNMIPYLSCDMTKPTKWVCSQQRLRSAWESTQSDQSSLSAWRKHGSLATHWMHSEDSDQTGQMSRLISVFARCTLILLGLSCRGSFHLSDMFPPCCFYHIKVCNNWNNKAIYLFFYTMYFNELPTTSFITFEFEGIYHSTQFDSFQDLHREQTSYRS